MRTGTITFHAPNNNGSFLQAYALQTVLNRQLGVENEIINYQSEQQIRQYSVFRYPKSTGDVGRNLISLMHYAKLKRRHNRFEMMRKENLILSEQYSTANEVYDTINSYDVLICGSDQIWNTEARDYSDVYFMTRADKKKISYAASFGSHIENVNKEKVLLNLSDFKHISVRERAGRDLCNELLPNKQIEIVCDPTLLLSKNEYCKLEDKVNLKNPYIFLYTINFSNEILMAAQKLSKEMKIPVYAAYTSYSCVKCIKYGIKVLYDVGPAQFLWLINNATYICSNSFHGVVFSIIYEKQFCRPSFVNEDGTLVVDDRIDNLLNLLGLNERSVNHNNMNFKILHEKIDYIMVREKLDRIRENGILYLEKAIKD